jgi:hypothetical protein
MFGMDQPLFKILNEIRFKEHAHISFESRSKWKRKNINKSVSLPRKTNGLLTALPDPFLIHGLSPGL